MADRTVIFLASGGVLQGVSSTADNVVCNGVVFNTDVTLERGAANRLDLLTGDSLNIVNGNLQFGGTTIIDAGGHGTFTTDSTDPGVNVGTVAGDPSSLANGDIWYNSTTNKFRGYQNGAAADLISAGTASGWTDGGTEVYLTTTTDEVTVGPTGYASGKFVVAGDDAAQVTVAARAAGTQTADIFRLLDSSGVVIEKCTPDGITHEFFSSSGTTNFQYVAKAAGGGIGGYVRILAGAGGDGTAGAAGGNGGQLNLYSGNGGAGFDSAAGTAGQGAYLTLLGGTGGAGNAGTNPHAGALGGIITVTGGTGGAGTASSTSGPGGNVTIQAGAAGASGGGGGNTGGTVNIYAGAGTQISGGGAINVTGGSAPSSGAGGTIVIDGGTSSTGTGGAIYVRGGTNSSGGTGGTVYVRGGLGGVTNGSINVGDSNTNQINVGTATCHTRFTSGCQVTPSVDNTCSLGTNSLRWNLIRGTTITSGDLQLENDDGSAAWTIREMPDHILAINRITGKKYRLAMEPVSE